MMKNITDIRKCFSRKSAAALLAVLTAAGAAVCIAVPGMAFAQTIHQNDDPPEPVPIIDTTEYEEARDPVNPLSENVLKYDLVTKGKQYDAAGLLTYKIENGKATIMSCDPAVKGELYIPDYIEGCPVTAINDYAFLYCANLTALTLPATVTDIGDYAFCYCTQLASVTAGGTASSGIVVGDHAFYRCYDLKKLDYGYIKEIGNYAFAYSGLSMTSFKEGLQTIGAYAFEGCGSLTTIKLPSSLTTIGDFAFDSCEALTYVEFPARLTNKGTGGYILNNCDALKSIKPSDSWSTVPDGIFARCATVDPYCVLKEGMTEIGDGAFYLCDGIERHLVIPSTVTRIGSTAFQYAGKREADEYGAAIDQVDLPDGLVYIGANAFRGAKLKDTLDLPDTVEEIGTSAFEDSELTGTLKLPASLRVLGDRAFTLNKLTEVRIAGALSKVGASAFSSNMSLVNVTIENGSDSDAWGSGVFGSCRALESITLPDTWTSIPDSSFNGCTALTDINIPLGVTKIGAAAFMECTSLKKLTLPSGLQEIGRNAFNISGLESVNIPSGIKIIRERAFRLTKISGSITLPSSLSILGENAFEQCTGITSVDIKGGSLRIMPSSAFEGCTALKRVTIGSGPEKIGGSAFKGCTALETVTLPSTMKYIGVISDDNGMNHRADLITSEGSGQEGTRYKVFADCTSLRSVNLPEGLISIDGESFINCTSLEKIKLPSTMKFLGKEAFKNSGIRELEFAEGIEPEAAVGEYSAIDGAYEGCSRLTSVKLPSSWTYIPEGLMYGCTGAFTVNLTENITYIGGFAFEGCTGLTSITIPSSVTAIGKKAFYKSGLKSITVPDSVTEENLGEYAIGGCASLSDIKLPSSWTTLPDGLFEGNTSIGEYTVPDNFTAIGKAAFKNSSLKKITMHSGVTSIGDEAFRACTGLTEIALHSGITAIGENAFDGCTGLTSVTVPGSVKKISALAFGDCDSLRTVVIEDGVESIDGLAFGFCDKLESISVPASVVNIGHCAFYNSNPGVLRLECPAGSKAAECAALLLYVRSDYNKSSDLLTNFKMSDRSSFETSPGNVKYVPRYYWVDYKGITYQVEIIDPGAQIFQIDYRWNFRAIVESLSDELKNSPAIENLTFEDYLANSAIPITGLESQAFSGCTNIKSVTLGKNIQSMSENTFADCTGLVSVDMSGSSVGVVTGFKGCTSLKSIKLPAVATGIGKAAFRDCVSLTSFDLTGTQIKTIGADAFWGCTSLKSIKLREGLASIASYAFYDTGLTEITLPSSLEQLQPDAFRKGSVTYYFTGDATSVMYQYTDGYDVHYAPVLPLILEYVGSRVGQFFGKGLDKQDTYFISTGTAGLNVPYGMQSASVVFGIGGVPVGDPSSTADGELSSQASSDSISDTMPDSMVTDNDTKDESDVTEPKEKLVYEVVRDAIAENPLMTAAVLVIIAALAALGGMRRYRRSRRQG